MVLRLSLIFCINFFLALPAAAVSQASVSLELLKKNAEVAPPGVVNIPFFIENSHSGEFEPSVKIVKPDGWDLITSKYPPLLNGGDKVLSLASIRIPAAYPVGSYDVFIEIYDKKENFLQAKGKIVIAVSEVEQISVKTLYAPDNIFAGDTCKAVLIIQNNGNNPEKIFLETTGCSIEGYNELFISPGDSKKIDVYKITPPDILKTAKEVYTVRALVSGVVYESISLPVTIFPVKAEQKDLFLRFPVSFSLTGLAVRRDNIFQTAPQTELSGSGAVDAEGKHRISFVARGPDNTNMGFIGTYDQYNFSYSGKNIRVSAGERSYSFTPLTESSRYGTGFENTFLFNNGLSFGFLYVKPRFYEEISNELSVYSLFEKNENSAGVHYVQKKMYEDGTFSRLASFSANIQPFSKTRAALELSRGYWKGLADNAFRVNVNTSLYLFRISGNYYYAGRNYPGYYTNSSFYSGSVSAQIFSKLNLGIHLRKDFGNARLDTFFVTAPFTGSKQAFLNYSITPRSTIKLYWRDYERKDRFSPGKFHYRTSSLNTQLNQKLNRFSYTLTGEFGETVNYLMANDSNTIDTYRGTVTFYYNFNSENSLRLFGSWSNINSFVSDDQRNLTAGISARSRILKNLYANFHLQNGYDIDDYYKNRNLINLSLDYNFLRNQSISLKSYYMLFRGEIQNPEIFVSATYSYKIGVPLKKISEAGSIKGRVTNREGEPVSGIVLQLINNKTISDKNGLFWFRFVQPGIHLMTVDRSGLAPDEVPAVPLPLNVEVISDRQTDINIMIVKGAKLEGSFSFPENENFPEESEKKSLENIILEFSNGVERFSIATDKDGKFSFPLVVPGKWTLKVFGNSIPQGYEAEKSIYQFELKDGERIYLNPVLKRKTRNIIFKPGNINLSN